MRFLSLVIPHTSHSIIYTPFCILIARFMM
nr:MAG TPA: hypothetical protein [Caudoviricetes sp.]